MKQKQIKKDKMTRAQLQKLMPGELQTYLQRMWHASDGIEPIVTMQRASGILMELHTMAEREPTYMMTTSGKRSRVSIHDLSDVCQALKNWVGNTALHGSLTVTWQDLQDSWEPTAEDRGEIISEMAFNMPLDEWQEAWVARHPEILGDDIASMVMTSAMIQMMQKLQLAEREYLDTIKKPETYGISMRHGQHGLMNNTLQKLLQELKQHIQNGIDTQNQ